MSVTRSEKKPPRRHGKGRRSPRLCCAGCGESDLPVALLRVVVSEAFGVVVDLRERIPGTAFHLHARAACLAAASQRNAISETKLRGAIERFLDRSILSELSRVAASGQAIGGHDKLADRLRQGDIACVVVASDAAANTIESLRRVAGASVRFFELPIDKESLGARLGQAPRAAVGFPSCGAAALLERRLAQRRRVGESMPSSSDP